MTTPTMQDRIRQTVLNLEKTPGYRFDEAYDEQVHTPIQEAIDLLRELMVGLLTLKATPKQIEALAKLMTEETLDGYSCMPLEEFDRLQTKEEVSIPVEEQGQVHNTAHTTIHPEERIPAPVQSVLRKSWHGRPKSLIPEPPEEEVTIPMVRGIDGLLHKPGEEPYLEDGFMIYPGKPTLLGM